MTEKTKPLLIKRYASRRLYNTESSDYVTLEDIAGFIRSGREVQIIDLKSGDDLTRQYLLQIIAEHESRGESVLPVEVLTDLVRSYATQATSVVPQFLAASFEMLRDGQSKAMENLTVVNPMTTMPGFEITPFTTMSGTSRLNLAQTNIGGRYQGQSKHTAKKKRTNRNSVGGRVAVEVSINSKRPGSIFAEKMLDTTMISERSARVTRTSEDRVDDGLNPDPFRCLE